MATFTDRSWDGSASRWPDAKSFCASCLIDLTSEGEDPDKANCKLPVKEPDGAINKNAVHAAASALAGGRGGVKAPSDAKKKAAKTLCTYYAQMKEDAPDSLKQLAGA